MRRVILRNCNLLRPEDFPVSENSKQLKATAIREKSSLNVLNQLTLLIKSIYLDLN